MLSMLLSLFLSIVLLGSGVSGIDDVNYWFSFGDSYTQTGFVTNGTLPTPGNPLGNPTYPGQTAVGGTNWIDVDTTVYNNSLVLTYNYAYGGATIDASLVTPYEPTVLSLTDQVNEFLDTAAGKPTSTPWTSSNSLFSIWIGINDIGNSYYLSGDRYAFDDTLLNAEFALVQKLCAIILCIRSSYAFCVNEASLTTLDIQMLAQSATSQATEKAIIADFNYKLAERISAFKTNHSWVQTWLWDSNSAFTAVLNSPTSYGFVDVTSYGNPGDFWGNNYHPSSAAHDIWGKEIALLLERTVW
ncbi:carbohydrate esterase family 16 protein [Piloderma croceum F 1598]|uniref:Carbohydrate esterase family 16 protein n=1 Tax=Piloderma croceum (strain F 1598) TaxID=765440 RepID=A0A0C3ETB4_PILCF|nr:carbohydrate esterase family 16 protein [Piloderma croceum F 1598]